jgi:hypothetical protein
MNKHVDGGRLAQVDEVDSIVNEWFSEVVRVGCRTKKARDPRVAFAKQVRNSVSSG